jgi:hypothetical protein
VRISHRLPTGNTRKSSCLLVVVSGAVGIQAGFGIEFALGLGCREDEFALSLKQYSRLGPKR